MQRKRSAIGWLFLSPYIIVVGAFLFTPLAYAGWMSIHTHKLVGGTRLAPLANFKYAFTDAAFFG